jgi:uncharacterized Fe-S radical SAM superfamily protein PflX
LLGKKIANVMQSTEDAAQLPTFTLDLWLGNLLYTPSVMFIKLSIVALYWRLFGVNDKGRYPIMIVGGVIIAWGIAIVS